MKVTPLTPLKAFAAGLGTLCLVTACSSNDTNPSGSSNRPGTGGNPNTTGSSNYGGNSSTGGHTTGASSVGGNSSSGGSSQAGVTPPSCKTSGVGTSDCGASHESCCASNRVPGGTFFRTYTNDGTGVKDQDDEATLSDFRLDKYLVTLGRYRQFVAAWNHGSGYTPAAGSGKHTHLNNGKGLADSGNPGSYELGWVTGDAANLQLTSDNLACDSAYSVWTDTPGSHENLPMNCVNWWEAYAFCIWDGGFLPSEAEYKYAAAGGSEQRRYPWGANDAGLNAEYAICNCNYPDASGSCTGIANMAPVGTAKLGAGRWGHLDLVGDVTEWNLDWFSPSYVNPCTDCAYVADGSGKVIRDGYFSSADGTLQVPYRNSLYPTNRFYSFGFRCARTY